MEKIFIVGSGGFAKETAFLIDEINRKEKKWQILGFVDKKIGSYNGKYKVVINDNQLLNYKTSGNVVFGLGSYSLIKKLTDLFSQNPNIKFPNLIHPNVVGDWERIKLGKGNIITAGNIFTTDIEVGSFNVFNLDCTIGHDTVIGNCNIFNPSVNISGGVSVKNNNLIGTGVQILQYKNINTEITVGAGSLVTKDLIEAGVYVGIPAKKIK